MARQNEDWIERLQSFANVSTAVATLSEALVQDRDHRGLIQLWVQASTLLPESSHALHFRALLQQLDMVASAVESNEVRSEILLETGMIADERLGDPKSAIERYQAAFKASQFNLRALELARRVYVAQKNYGMGRRLYDLQLKAVREPSDQAATLTAAARFVHVYLPESDEAKSLLEQALARVPGFAPALELKAEMAAGAVVAEPPPASESAGDDGTTTRMAPLTDEQAGAGVGVRDEGADVQAAGRSEEAPAVAARPASPKAPVAAAGPHPAVQAARELAAASGWAAAYKSLDDALTRAGSAAERNQLAEQAGELAWKEGGDLDRADGWFKRVRLADARNRTMLSFYVAQSELQGDPRKQQAALQALLAVLDGDDAVDVQIRLAQLAEEKLDNPSRALDLWVAVRKARPDDDTARAALRRILPATGKWTRLIELLREEQARLSEADESAQQALREELFAVYRDHANMPIQADATALQILEHDAAHVSAYRWLSERYRHAERSSELASLLRSWGLATGGIEGGRALHEAALLYRDELGRPDDANEVLLGLLERDPSNEEVFAELESTLVSEGKVAERVAIRRARLAALEGAVREAFVRATLDVAASDESLLLPCLLDACAVCPEDDALLDRALLLRAGMAAQAWDAFGVAHLQRRFSDALAESLVEARISELHDAAGALELAREWMERSPTVASPFLMEALAASGLWVELVEQARTSDMLELAWELLEPAAAEHTHLFGLLADFAADDLNDMGRLIPVLQRWFGVDSDNSAIVRRLVDAEVGRGGFEQAAGWLDVLLNLQSGAPATERALLHDEAAALHSERTLRSDLSLDHVCRALELAPSRERLQRAVSLGESLGSPAQVCEALERAIQSAPLPDERSEWLRELSRLQQSAGLDEGAVAHWRALLGLVPGDSEALDALEALLGGAQRWDEFVAALEEAIATVSPELGRALRYRIVRIRGEKLGQVHETIAELERLVQSDRDDRAAWSELRRLRVSAGHLEAAMEAAANELRLADDDADRTGALLMLAQLHLDTARESAALGYIREAFKSSPESEHALATDMLLQLVDRGLVLDAAPLVDPLLESAGRWADLLRVLVAQSRALSSVDAAQWARMAEIAEERCDDRETALLAWTRWLESEVPTPAAWQALQRLTANAEDLLSRWRALLETHGLTALSWSIEAFAERLMATSHNAEAWRLRARWCHEEASSLQGEAAAALYVRAGQIRSGQLGDMVGAVASFRAALKESPLDDEAFTALHGLLTEQSADGDLDQLLTQRIAALREADGSADDLEVARGLLVGLRARNPGQYNEALEVAGDALEANPAALGVIADVQQIFEASGEESASFATAHALLMSTWRALGDQDEITAQLHAAVTRAPESMRPGLHFELAQALATDPEMADEALEHVGIALVRDPSIMGAVELLCSTAQTTGRWVDALGALEQAAEALEQVELWLLVADTYERELGDLAESANSLERALALQGDSLTQVERLCSLRRSDGDLAQLAAALQRLAALQAEGSAERTGTLLELAGVHAQMDRAEESIATWESLLGDDDQRAVARRALLALYRATGRYVELATLLRDEIAATAAAAERAALHRALGELYDDQLNDPTEAVLQYDEAVALQSDDVEAWRQLARLHGDADRYDLLVDALRALIPLLQGGERHGSALQLARVLQQQLFEAGAALEVLGDLKGVELSSQHSESYNSLLEALLEASETQEAAAELLATRYRDAGNDAALAVILGRQSQFDLSPERRAEYLDEAADLYATSLQDLDAALTALLERFVLLPDSSVLSRIQSLALHANAAWRVADELGRVLHGALPADLTADIHVMLAGLLRESGGDADDVSQHLAAAQALRPHDAGLLQLLYEVMSDAGRWSELADLLETAAAAMTSREDALVLHERLNALFSGPLDDDERAMRNAVTALELDSGCVFAIETARRVCENRGDLDALVDLLERIATQESDASGRARLRFERAQRLLALGRRDDALEDVEQVVADAPALDGVDTLWLSCLDSAEVVERHQESAYALLSRLAAQSRWSEWVLLARFLAPGLPPAEAVVLLDECASTLRRHLNESGDALECQLQAFGLRELTESDLHEVLESAQVAGRWGLVADAFAARAADGAGVLTAQLLETAAGIAAEHLHELSQAIGLLEQSIDADPTRSSAYAALVNVLQRAERDDALIDVLERWADASSNADECCTVLLKLAAVHRDARGDFEAALPALRRAVQVAPENEIARRHLLSALERTEAWDELAQELSLMLDSAAPSEVVRLARIRITRQGDVDGGLELLNRLFSIGATPDAVAVAHLLLEAVADGSPQLQGRVGAGTAEVFAAAEDAAHTAKALQYAMAVAVAGVERAALLRRTAELRLASDADAAFDDAMAALRDDPRSPDNVALLEQTAQAADRWNELVLALQTIAEDHGDAALAAQLLERASTYAATRQHDTEESLQLLRLAVERAPSDDGWQKLQAAFLAAGQPQQWADVLLRRREDASGSEERTRLLYEWLTLAAQAGLAAQARISLLRDGLQDAPGDERLLGELESLCTEAGDWDGVADALQERLDAATDADERFSLACQLASLHTERRADAVAAADAWRVALGAQAGHVAALESFAAVLSDLQEWPELATILEQLAEQYGENVAAAHNIWLRLATLQLELMDDSSAALRSVQRVLDVDPADAESIALLWRIGMDEAAAIDLLDALTSQSGDATDRIRLLELRIAQEPDPAERARRSFELANLTESSTGDEELAFHYRCEAATLEPDNEAWLNGVLAAATVPARVPRAAAVLQVAIEHATSAAERRVRRLQLASLWLEVAGDKDGAIEPLRDQLAENPADVDAFELLLPLYDAATDTAQHVALLLDHAAALPGHEGDRHRWQALRLTETVTRDAQQALAILQQIASGADRDEAFDRIAESAGLIDELLADLRERVGHTDDEVARGALWLRIAGLLLGDVGRMTEAAQAFEQASQCAGAEDEALEGLVSLWSSRDALPELCDTLARQIARTDDPGLRSSLVRYRLDVAQRLGDRPTIITLLEALLEYDPTDDDSAKLLVSALVAEQRWPEAVVQLRRASERENDGARRRVLWMQTADIAADSLGDFELAESLWRRVAADAPGSPEADRALQGLVRLVEKRGDPDAAIHMLLDILSAPIVPASAGPMWEQLGNLMRQQNRPATEWMDAWNRALLAGHVSQKMLEDMERNVQGTGDTDRLLTLYATASRAGLIRTDRRRRWADLLVSARRFDEAIAALEAGVREGDTDPALSSQLVTLMLERGQVDAAAAALDAWADRPATRNSRAEQPMIMYLRGRLALARGNPAEALEAYQRSFSLDPSFVPNLMALGILYLGQQKNEDALRMLQTALQHQNRIDNDRLRVELFFRLAEVRHRTGDNARARDMLQRALAIDANHEPARRLARELG